jgi:transposase-like protein
VNPKSQKYRKYSAEFRQQALARLKECDNVSALARELGIRRKWLYKWREDANKAQKKLVRDQAAATRKQVADLERLVARQALEIDFFAGALQRIEERRRKRGETSGPASTSKSNT